MVTFNPYDPKTAFLMGAGQNLLQAGGWSPVPVRMGQALGAGLQGGLQSYRDAVIAQRAAQRQKLEEGMQRMQMARAAAQERYLATLPEDQQLQAQAMGVPEYMKANMETGGWLEGSGAASQMFNTYETVLNKLQNNEPVTPREYQRASIAYANLTQPKIYRDPDTGQEVTTRPNYPPLPPMQGTAPLTPVRIEGAEEMTVTQAGQPVAQDQTVTTEGGTVVTRRQVKEPKLSTDDRKTIVNARAALADLDVAQERLFTNLDSSGQLTPQSELKETAAIAGGLNIPKTEGRGAMQAIRRTVEVLLRMRTGAQAKEEEVDLYTDLYSPQVWDSDQDARMKMARLRSLFADSMALAERGRFAYQGGDVESGSQDLALPNYQQAGQGDRPRRKYNPQTGRIE